MNISLLNIGQTVRKLRISQGKRQKQLAEETHSTANYICLLESGRRGISLSRLEIIAGALGISSIALMLLAVEQSDKETKDAPLFPAFIRLQGELKKLLL